MWSIEYRLIVILTFMTRNNIHTVPCIKRNITPGQTPLSFIKYTWSKDLYLNINFTRTWSIYLESVTLLNKIIKYILCYIATVLFNFSIMKICIFLQDFAKHYNHNNIQHEQGETKHKLSFIISSLQNSKNFGIFHWRCGVKKDFIPR